MGGQVTGGSDNGGVVLRCLAAKRRAPRLIFCIAPDVVSAMVNHPVFAFVESTRIMFFDPLECLHLGHASAERHRGIKHCWNDVLSVDVNVPPFSSGLYGSKPFRKHMSDVELDRNSQITLMIHVAPLATLLHRCAAI